MDQEKLEEIKELIEKTVSYEGEIKASSDFADDLKMDSLDSVELMMALEDLYDIEISDEDALKLRTIEKVANFVNKKLEESDIVEIMSEYPDEFEQIKNIIEDISPLGEEITCCTLLKEDLKFGQVEIDELIERVESAFDEKFSKEQKKEMLSIKDIVKAIVE